ncbi:MAG: hypothetical protein ACRENP_21340 [Longimicrobiales bacterium]
MIERNRVAHLLGDDAPKEREQQEQVPVLEVNVVQVELQTIHKPGTPIGIAINSHRHKSGKVHIGIEFNELVKQLCLTPEGARQLSIDIAKACDDAKEMGNAPPQS